MNDNAKSPVLIICGGGYVSGKEVMTLELGKGLVRNGQQVYFITSSWNDGDFLQRLKHAGLPTQILPLGFISATLTRECLRMTLAQGGSLPRLLWKYSRMLRVSQPKRIIHTNWHHLLLLLPFVQGNRDVFWLHELIPNLPRYRTVFRWFDRRLRYFICVSRAVAHSLRQLGIDEAKIRVVHNGITDLTSTTPSLNPKVFRIGIVGQVGAWKGHDDLLEGFALVRKKYANAELHIFGHGAAAYKGSLERRSIDLGIADAVRWHGFVQDLTAIYPNLDVCVVPSRSQDPLPTSAIEAGFSGLPVVATRQGGLPEIVEHETNGLLVDPKQPMEMARALCRLIENPQLREYLGKNARRIATERFSRERFLDEFDNLLQVLQ